MEVLHPYSVLVPVCGICPSFGVSCTGIYGKMKHTKCCGVSESQIVRPPLDALTLLMRLRQARACVCQRSERHISMQYIDHQRTTPTQVLRSVAHVPRRGHYWALGHTDNSAVRRRCTTGEVVAQPPKPTVHSHCDVPRTRVDGRVQNNMSSEEARVCPQLRC